MNEKVLLGADPFGFSLKERIKEHLLKEASKLRTWVQKQNPNQ